jgi:predicted RNase H-like nuclease
MQASVLGIDWAKRGWVGVVLRDASPVEVLASRDIATLVTRVQDAAVVAVDMPIGLPVKSREADSLARAFVGRRRHSVFMTPPREVLEAGSYSDANTTAEQLIGKRISQQAWALRKNIKVVEALAALDERVIEVHPEVSFREMAGYELKYAKTTWNGQHARRSLLTSEDIDLRDDLAEAGVMPVADILDAAAAAWSARRYARGTSRSFPAAADRGQREVIWL